MPNYPVLFLNPTTGCPEQLLPVDGGITIDVINCATAGAAVELFNTVDSSGWVSILAGYDGTAYIGKTGGSVEFNGWVHVNEGCEVHGLTSLKGAATFGVNAADDITFNGSVVSYITFKAAAPHGILQTGANLTVQTAGSGTLFLTSVGLLSLNGASATLNTTGSVSFTAGTTFGISAGAGSDLTLGALGGTVTLNQGGNTTLHTAGTPPIFTATSIVGALNELRAAVSSTVFSDIAGAGGVTKGDLVCLVWSGAQAEVFPCNSAVPGRDRPIGVALATAAGAASCYYTTAGIVVMSTNIVTHNEGEYLWMGGAPGAAGSVSLTPGAGTRQIVGVLRKIGAGTTEMAFQPLLPATAP